MRVVLQFSSVKISIVIITDIIKDYEGRFIGCNITTLNGLKFGLCNVYGPNQDKPAFYQALAQNITCLFPEKILAGDFNLVLDTEKDRYLSTKNNNRSRSVLKDIMDEEDLEEVWRNRNPAEIRYSWRRGNEQASRIDFALLTKSIEPLCENCMYFSKACILITQLFYYPFVI